MSLGDTTKCDLCAEQAVIDKTELINILRLAFRVLRDKITDELKLSEYQSTDIDKLAFEFTVHRSKTIELLLKELSKTAELLHTLKESDDRENTIFV